MMGRRITGLAAMFAASLVVAMIVAPVQAQHQSPNAAELTSMKSDYKRAPAVVAASPEIIELGRLLFWDPRISASGKTSCASCHLPYLGWAVTDARSRADSGRLTSRKSQTLIGIGHIKDVPYGWDGRNATLEAQVINSISSGSMSMQRTSTPVKVEAIEERLRAIPEYVGKFRAVLPGLPISMDTIAKVIADYERTFEPGIAPFDRWVDGDESAISESAKRGFALFNTKAGCAACHAGWRFTDDQFHDIGTSISDLGRGRVLKNASEMRHAFKTPTLRSVALRPPYMHNGTASNLYDVVLHYERGGIDRPSRSPAMAPLTLTEQDRLDLVAFMQSLTGVREGDTQPALPKPN